MFGWAGLAFIASLVFKWAICTISLALILAAHTTKLQAQLLAHPSIRRLWRTWKRNSPIVKLPDWKSLQLLLLTWAVWKEAAPARPAPKPPTLPKLSDLPTSFPEWWRSPMCVHWHALGGAGIPTQELITGEKKARLSFLFNLEPW